MTKHTDSEIDSAAARLERWADSLDPVSDELEDLSDLRAIAEAADAVRAEEARLREAIELARGRGRSWNRIALALGVSRQAARQRFAAKAGARSE